jgi:hypothetical protein
MSTIYNEESDDRTVLEDYNGIINSIPDNDEWVVYDNILESWMNSFFECEFAIKRESERE